MRIKVCAKVNLSLEIKGVSDGLHELDMVNASLDVADYIDIKKSEQNYCVDIDKVKGVDNVAFKVAEQFKKEFSTCGVSINIEKGIPFMAGMGGSSADGAGVLYGMSKMYGITDVNRLIEVGSRVGSDIPAMFVGGFVRVKGRGELVEKINSTAKLYVIALKKERGNGAGQVYAQYDKTGSSQAVCTQKLTDKLLEIKGKVFRELELIEYMGNHLQEPALVLNAEMQDCIDELQRVGADKVMMFGSGSMIGGFFVEEQKAKEALKEIKGNYEYKELLQTKEVGIEIV